jgi:hypothetical protein
MSTLKTALLGSGMWLASAFLTFGILVFAGDASRGGDRKQRVAFSEFLAMVEDGHVETVRVSGRAATFRLLQDGRTVEGRTLGPFEDRAQVLALRPSNPALPAPKVEFEK